MKALMTQIGSTLINVFKPVVKVLNTVLKHILKFVKTVGDALGTIFGWTMEVTDVGIVNDVDDDVYEPISSGLDDIADSAKKGSDALEDEKEKEKELQRTIMGFDEINKLNPENKEEEKANTGDDPAKGTADAAKALGNLSGAIDDVGVAIKPTTSAFESSIDTLFKLGEFIGTSLKNALESIDWPSVYQGAKDFGTGLAEFLNGLISPELFGAIGTTVGNAINTALNALNSFAYTFDFKNLGESINEGIKRLAGAINTKLLTDTLKNWGKGIADTLNAAFNPKTANSVGDVLGKGINAIIDGIRSFVDNAKWANYGKTLNAGIKGFLDALDMENIESTMGKIGDGLATMLNKLADPGLWSRAGSMVGGWLNAITNFFLNFGKKLDWEGWGKSINTGIDSLLGTIKWGAFREMLVTWASGIAGFLNNVITPSLGGSIGSAVARFGSSLLAGLNSFGEKLDWANLGASIKTFVNSALENFDWNLLGTTINTWANGFLTLAISFFTGLNWGELFNGLATALSAVKWSTIATNAISAIWSALSGEGMSGDKQEQAYSSFSRLEEVLRNLSGFVFQGIIDLYNDALKPIGQWVLGEGIPALADIISNQLEIVDWDKLSSGISGLVSALGSFTVGVFEGFTMFFEELSKFPLIGILLNAIGNGLNTLFGSLDGQDKKDIQGIGEAVGALLGAIVAAKFTMSIANAIKGLADAASLPALLAAIVAHPVAAVIAGGTGIALAVAALLNAAGPAKGSKIGGEISSIAEGVKELSAELSKTDIDAEGNYKYISGILDKYMELNSKLIENGSLSESDQSMFEHLYNELAEYGKPIADALGDVGEAYKGNREQLEMLIKTQTEYVQMEAYWEIWDEANKAIAKQTFNMEILRSEIKEALIPSMEEFAEYAKAFGVDFTYNEDDLNSFVNYLMDGSRNEDLLTQNMQHIIDLLSGDFDWVIKDAELAVEGFEGSWNEIQTSTAEANKAIDAVQKLIGKFPETVENSNTKVSSSMQNAATKSGEAKDLLVEHWGTAEEIIKGKADGIYTSADAKFDDINKSLEAHGISGNGIIEGFTWGGTYNSLWDSMIASSKNGQTEIETTVENTGANAETKLDVHVQNMERKTEEGISNMETAVTNNGNKVVTAVDEAIIGPTELSMSSFALGTSTVGIDADENLAQGLRDSKNDVGEAADEIAEEASSGLMLGGSGRFASRGARRISALKGSVYDTVKNGIISATEETLGISGGSDSSVMSGIGDNVVTSIQHGSESAKPNLLNLFKRLPGNLDESLGDILAFFTPSGEETVSGMKTGFNNLYPKFEEIFVKLPTKLKDAMSTLESTFKAVGRLIVNSIKMGVEDSTVRANLDQALIDLRSTIKAAFNGLDQDLYAIGQNAITGLRNGWTSTHIPVPHFGVSGNTATVVGDKTVYLPQYSVSWFAKGGMATAASIIGVGEAGKEAILPLENSRSMRTIADSIASKAPMADENMLTNAMVRALAIAGQNRNDNGNQILNVVVKTENDEVLARAVTRGQKKIDYRMNPVSQL